MYTQSVVETTRVLFGHFGLNLKNREFIERFIRILERAGLNSAEERARAMKGDSPYTALVNLLTVTITKLKSLIEINGVELTKSTSKQPAARRFYCSNKILKINNVV